MKAQRRPDTATLNLIAPLLDDLRGLHGIEERRQGHFYFDSRELIHFHQLPNDVVADVRFDNDFARMPINTRAQQLDVLDRILHTMSALEAKPKKNRRRSDARSL